MSYNQEIYIQAQARIDALHQKAVAENNARKAEFTARCPEYAEAERAIGRTSALIAKAMLREGGDVNAALCQIRDNNLAQQKKMAALLAAANLPPDYLTPQYTCTACNDTGFIDGRACDCLKAMMRRIRLERLNASTPLKLSTFDTFNLDNYPDECDTRGLSPRKIMEITLAKCKRYAQNFSLDSESLLFQGGVGLGKTHLSLAIAREVIERGYGVLYSSAQAIFSQIEKEHFGRATVNADTLETCKQCDLLILDDLGAEFVSPFLSAMLYDLVNTRLLASRPTIISTNLNADGLQERYTERIASRIIGNYSRYPFVGKDLRIKLRQKRKENN